QDKGRRKEEPSVQECAGDASDQDRGREQRRGPRHGRGRGSGRSPERRWSDRQEKLGPGRWRPVNREQRQDGDQLRRAGGQKGTSEPTPARRTNGRRLTNDGRWDAG